MDEESRELRDLLKRVAQLAPSETMRRRALKMRAAAMLPMELVLRRVEGKTIADKARTLGIERQTVHYWVNGETRPNKTMAKKLAAITGYDVEAIRGIPAE